MGELLGAADFITTVIAGSMALVTPFQTKRDSFVRDASVLGINSLLLLSVLLYGELKAWYCGCMIAFHVLYLLCFVGYHWWLSRRSPDGVQTPRLADTVGARAERLISSLDAKLETIMTLLLVEWTLEEKALDSQPKQFIATCVIGNVEKTIRQ